MPPIATYVFFNFATTGLLNENPEITELHMSAVTTRALRKYFKDGGAEYFAELPDVNNLHCQLEDDVMWFLGTEHRDPEECDLEDEITDFLDGLEKPLCLIAYNGPRFHFPLLRSVINAARFSTKGMLCADAMAAFYDILEPESALKTSYAERALDRSFPWPYQVDMKSYRLKDVCKRELGFYPDPDTARVRNKAMMRISLGMSYEFMLWVTKNNYPFTTNGAQCKKEEEDVPLFMIW